LIKDDAKKDEIGYKEVELKMERFEHRMERLEEDELLEKTK
jgi:hypothetical protein